MFATLIIIFSYLREIPWPFGRRQSTSANSATNRPINTEAKVLYTGATPDPELEPLTTIKANDPSDGVSLFVDQTLLDIDQNSSSNSSTSLVFVTASQSSIPLQHPSSSPCLQSINHPSPSTLTKQASISIHPVSNSKRALLLSNSSTDTISALCNLSASLSDSIVAAASAPSNTSTVTTTGSYPFKVRGDSTASTISTSACSEVLLPPDGRRSSEGARGIGGHRRSSGRVRRFAPRTTISSGGRRRTTGRLAPL